jgi:glycosyltransferase involved in cell wall biosynthesis
VPTSDASRTASREGNGAVAAADAPPLRGQPARVSVVIPIFNEEEHLDTQLASLAAQTYDRPWEVVAVDNRCTDRSMEIVESWRDRLPALVVVNARARRGLNFARNTGAAAAQGDFLAFCDADDVTAPNWLEELVRAGATADIVGGPVEMEQLNDELQRAWQPTDSLTSLPASYGFMPYPPGGNCGIWADVAREVGWDESYRFGASDIEFGWRAQLAGYRMAFAPGALIQHRFKATIRSTFAQYFRYGVSEPHLFKVWGRHGMERDLREAFTTWRWLAVSLPMLKRKSTRGRWVRVAGLCCGRICGSLRWRAAYL